MDRWMGWERSRKPRRRQMSAMILLVMGMWIAIAASAVMLIYLSTVLRTIKDRNSGLQEAIQAEQNLLASSRHKHQDAMKIAEANLQEVELNIQHKSKVRNDLREHYEELATALHQAENDVENKKIEHDEIIRQAQQEDASSLLNHIKDIQSELEDLEHLHADIGHGVDFSSYENKATLYTY